MVNTSKILTVSYGTFSCTLEGFDDSFGTMKAIAEYFRDLASDDRYFGAEPPTPDAEMLARIAEREIARRVNAHFEQNRIVLRADPGSTPTTESAAGTFAEDEGTDENAASEEASDLIKETDQAEEMASTGDDFAQGEPQENENIADSTAQSEVAEPDDMRAPATDEMPDETGQEGETAEQPEAATHAPIPSAGSDIESVAAKLQRIRAVVSQAETAETPTVAYSEDEHADDFISETHDDINAALEIDDEVEMDRADASEGGDEAADENDTISSLLSRFDSPDEDDENLFDETEDEARAFDIVDNETEADLHASDETAVETTGEIETESTVPGPEGEPEQAAETDTPRLRARIVKMKRADFEAAIADGSLEEEVVSEDRTAESKLSPEDEADLLRELAAVEAELAVSTDSGHTDTASEDGEDEDEGEYHHASLIDELENEEDEDDDETGEDSTNFFADEDNSVGEDEVSDEHDEDAGDTSGRTTPFAGTDAESEMGRIFEETDAHLNEETGRGRRNAIAHLRAAVEANKAEIGAGGDLAGEGPDSEVYRDDLASVVRPRRPQTRDQGSRPRRPETARPAPLKLVAEQRVDLEEAKSAPVRPRRVQVSTPANAEAAAASDFADYAESVGATSLPELLEAAAAYLSFVERREQFSRPQLMTHVREVEKDDFSREDGLRSFGQLLREGKIIKLKGGRFTASDSISYRPDARYAGE
ncbi:MAG: hypothetical protein HLUCCO07_03855 [Rhodobacteraceae bacterium HLUCCO07]|nr:MAG: hypothetical protein HLUCCO07_03855 [Rhodobacteraceae bacterium HLUCCO07]